MAVIPLADAAPEAPPAPAVPPARPRAARDASLTGRASLTAVASLLDYGTKIIVGLVVTPILVSHLGRLLYGVWEMLSRLGSYMSATDGRPTEALRLIIAQRQSESDEVKRRHVGEALLVWVMTLPIVLGVGLLLAYWIAPKLTRVPAMFAGDVKTATLMIVLTFVLTGLASIPESVLRGMNLGYRRMGLQSSLNILGGACAAGFVWMGLGLVGLGEAQVIRGAATGLCFWALTRKYVSWFGIARPSKGGVRSLFGMSLWLTAGDAIAKIMLASDVLILGAVLAPTMVTTYALTSYAARTATGIHVFAAGAAIPGLGGLLGQRQFKRAALAREELLLLTWLFTTIVGATILLWNHSFIGLWVGPQHYAGAAVDLLIVLASVQTSFIRTDSYVIDATLQPKLRVTFGAVAAVLTIALSWALCRAFGMPGLCAGVLLGRLVQTIAYPMMVRKSLSAAAGTGLSLSLRKASLTLSLFAAAAVIGERTVVSSWLGFGTGVLMSLLILFTLAVLVGATGTERTALAGRLRTLRLEVKRP